MAIIYVRSTDGSDSDGGSEWELAKATLAGAAAIDVPGDTIYLSQAHAEPSATALTIAFAGTLANPVKVICASDSAVPPTAGATTAKVTTTGASSITITGSAYIEGVNWEIGSGANVASMVLTGNLSELVFKTNTFALVNTHASSKIQAGSASVTNNSSVEFIDSLVKFGAAGQTIVPYLASFKWTGGGIAAGSVSPTSLILADYAGSALIENFDASAASATMNLCDATAVYGGTVLFRNIRLPAAWTGNIGTVTNPSARIELHNKDLYWLETYFGSVKTAAPTASGGSSDGATGFSMRLASSANCSYPANRLVTADLPAIWNETVGSPITVSVEIAQDAAAAALTTADIALEVQYLGTAGQAIATQKSSVKADTFAAATTYAAGDATWTGLTNPTVQKLAVTITPQVAGFVQARIALSSASKTVFVDWKLRAA